MKRLRTWFFGLVRKDERAHARCAQFRVERLERRALLASLEVISPAGIGGLATLDAQVDRNFVPLGTHPPSSSNGLNLVDVLPSDPLSPDYSEGYSSYLLTKTGEPGVTLLEIELVSQAYSATPYIPPMNPTTGPLSDCELATSLGGGLGDFITIKITPDLDEQNGDPVRVTLRGHGYLMSDGYVENILEHGTARILSRYEIDYHVAGSPQLLIAGAISSTEKNPVGRGDTTQVQFVAAVGQSIRVRMDAASRGQVFGQYSEAWGFASVNLQLTVQPATQADLKAKSLTYHHDSDSVVFSYAIKNAALDSAASAALYWASGDTTSDIMGQIDKPVFSVAIPAPSAVTQNDIVVTVPRSRLGKAPRGATHLLLVLDPGNNVAEASESNNVIALKRTFDVETFLALHRRQFGRTTTIQEDELRRLLRFIERDDALDAVKDVRNAAYMLATVRHETGTYQPIKESGCVDGRTPHVCTPLRNRQGKITNPRLYGDPMRAPDGTFHSYYGRGYVQLTGRDNYLLGGDALANAPELALQPDIAYQIMSYGMRGGLFTGHKLSDYITPNGTDYVNARAIINGDVRTNGPRVAGYARKFESILERSLVP